MNAASLGLPGPDLAPVRFVFRLKIGIVALNLGVALLMVISLYQSRDHLEAEAKINAGNLSTLLATDVAHIFDKIDQALLIVGDEASEQLKSGALNPKKINAFIDRQVKRVPELESIRVSDSQGAMQVGTGMMATFPVNISDEVHFIKLRGQDDAGLVITTAITSRVSGKTVVLLARRFNQPDGSFGGVLTAPIYMEQFVKKMGAVDTGRNGFVGLRDPQHAIVARYPEPVSSTGIQGQTIGVHQPTEQEKINPKSGVFKGRSPFDQIQRVYAYSRVPGYGFTVTVGLAEESYLSDWWMDVGKSAFILTVLALVTHLLTKWIVKGWSRREVDLEFIKKQEQKFRHLLDSTPDPLIFTNQGGTIMLANRQVTRLFGYEPEELVGQSVEILIPRRHRAHHPSLRQSYAKAPTSRDMSSDKPFTVLAKSGLEVPVTISLSPIETEQGLLVAVAIRDITVQKEIENALRTNTDRLIEAQRLAQLGSWTLDLASGKLEWSEEVFRMFEIDPKKFDATFEAFLNSVHPEDRAAVNYAYQNSLVNRRPYEITHRTCMADGRIKWVQERCITEFDAAGKPLRSQGTVQNVTERMLADEQLRIAAVAFESQESMLILDANRIILRVNHAFTDETGYSAEDVVGKPSWMFRSELQDQAYYENMEDILKRTGRWQGEVWGKRKNGDAYQKHLSITTVTSAEGVITHFINTQSDISERKAAEERIAHLAYHDALTGLPNRRLMMDRLEHARAVSMRTAHHAALLLLDLDDFKTLNDTRGHDMGDLLLKEVASRLGFSVRAGDTVARLGGDEFTVLLEELSADPDLAVSQAQRVGEKIRSALNTPYALSGHTLRSTPSIGITLFQGKEVSIEELMKQADLAMYKAKESGRNAIRFFDPAMQTQLIDHAALEADLREALNQQQFLLHYQAQINDRGLLMGVEVLVRWRHPVRGMVPPMAFIPLAETTGLILPLGRWVLETACIQLARWKSVPTLAHVSLAVNISAVQLHHTDFVAQVVSVLEKTGADPTRLKLELTESQLVMNVEASITKMMALKAMGVSFSMDDFGTGYSSLAYLKRLPLDQLKIDKSFVDHIETDANDAAIAKMIIALAISSNLNVIAEGVETQGQMDFLAALGCQAYQGYLFSRPLPLEEFEVFAGWGVPDKAIPPLRASA